MGSFRWVVLSVAAGLGLAAILFFAGHTTISGPLYSITFLVLLAVFLAGVPWLAFRPSALWWVATVAGLVIGLVGALFILVSVLRVITFCVIGPCPLPNPYAAALIYVVPLALMGVGQVLTLHGAQRRIGWLIATLIAAFVFPYGTLVAARLVGEDVNNPGFAAVLAGGAAWGLVTGSGLWALTSAKRA